MLSKTVVWMLSVWMLASCSFPRGEMETPPSDPRREDVRGPEKVLASNLHVPWSIAETGDAFYISERPGSIVRVNKDGGAVERKPVRLKKPVLHEGEGGFLGLTPAPDFKKSSRMAAYHTYREGEKILNRVVLLEEEANGWKEVKVLLEGIPGGFIHNGGRIAAGPDGKLYVTTGDAGKESLAQDRNSLAGKILRMEWDGRVPDDNPFPGSPVYSYGHRNPQGLAWSKDGALYSSEHGPSGASSGWDEINRIRPGRNYGWPVITGDEKKKGMERPLFHSGQDTWAPSGMTVDGKILYVAGLRGEQIRAFRVKERRSEAVFQGEGRLRDVRISDGFLYILTNNTDGRGQPRKQDDRLLRVKLSSLP